jgi:hypothetical protein
MPQSSNRITLLALAAIGCLTAMIAITLGSGVSQESFEIVRSPAVYAAELAAHPGALRALFGIDAVFLVLYATLFVVAGRALEVPATRTLVTLAIGAMLGTAVLDMVEDHHILAMLYGVEAGTTPTTGQLAFQHTLSQVKFNVSYLGLFALGLAVPRTTLAGRVLAVLLTVGTLVQGAWLYAAPVAMLPVGNFGRWLGFVVGFALLIPVARHRAGGAAETGAPA